VRTSIKLLSIRSYKQILKRFIAPNLLMVFMLLEYYLLLGIGRIP